MVKSDSVSTENAALDECKKLATACFMKRENRESPQKPADDCDEANRMNVQPFSPAGRLSIRPALQKTRVGG